MSSDAERLRRWRLVLGDVDPDEGEGTGIDLRGDDVRIDAALAAVYDTRPARRGGSARRGGLGSSAPAVTRWLGDIRRYFPTSVVQVMQRDAIERLDLRRLLLEPEMLRAVTPDLHLVTLLVELNKLLPDATRATARQVVAQVLTELERRLGARTRQAVAGALARSDRTHRPRPNDIDWDHTIRANLRHWIPERQTLVPERLVGFGHRRPSMARDVVVAVDQSASMADSVVYASLFAAVLASMPALRTSLVAFDTAVVDLTPLLHDPVDVLFGVRLGGGTDIGQAMRYCRSLVTRPSQTVIVVVTDLFEGANAEVMRTEMAAAVRSGATVVVLLALSDEGAPVYDHDNAAALAAMGIACVACTPDRFPDVLAAALEGRAIAGAAIAPSGNGTVLEAWD